MAITDFDEWLEQADLVDYDDIHSLYRAIQDVDEFGMFKCVPTPTGTAWIVSGGAIDDLLLASQLARDTFLNNLETKYCGDLDMEGWYQSKRGMSKND